MSRKALRDFYRLQAAQQESTEVRNEPEEVEILEIPQVDLQGELLEIVAARRQIVAQERQLESEQKALIYNNYKKLIKASQRLDQIDGDLEVPKLTTHLQHLAEQLETTRTELHPYDFEQLRAQWAKS